MTDYEGVQGSDYESVRGSYEGMQEGCSRGYDSCKGDYGGCGGC